MVARRITMAALAACATCATAHATDITAGLHLATAHFGGRGLQPRNPGLYARLDSGELQGLTAGTYRNSYGRRSTYLAWTGQTDDRRFAITLGGVTGYTAQRVMPLVVPSARTPITHGAALRVAFIPKPARHGTAAGLHVALEREF